MGAELARVRFFVAALKSGDFSYLNSKLRKTTTHAFGGIDVPFEIVIYLLRSGGGSPGCP
jgi:hypothetical protein